MTWNIDIERIAGILEGNATIEPGLNAVRGSNWQGKSSFIESVKTALGTSTELTEGADTGHVHLETPSGEYSVTLTRENGTIKRSGTPYLTDEYDVIRAELFACLDERNEVRQAVRRGENLEEVMMRPLDFQNIDEQIAGRQRERDQIASELSQAKEANKRLPSVQEKATRIEQEIEELRAKREELESAAAADGDGSPSATHRELSQARTEKDQVQNQIDRLEQSIQRAEQRLAERREELEGLDVPDDTVVEEELAEAREELSRVKRDAEVLQSVYSANKMILKNDRLDLITDVEREISGDTVVCWTCGSETSRADLAERIDDLGTRITNLRALKETQRNRVEELEARREELTQASRRKRDLEAEIAETEEKLADRKQSLSEANERLSNLEGRVSELSDRVDETVDELSDIESEIKYREAELNDTTNELAQLQSRADRLETLQDEHDEIRQEIADLRNRKERIKHEAREEFDDSMREILSRFGTGFETARLTPEFDIVVARDGREASLAALSEGELELIGFVAALAGRRTFEVAETVPLLLVDGLGGLADDNLHTLIDYLHEQTEYLVFTAYPEYTSFGGAEIDPTGWQIANESQAHAD